MNADGSNPVRLTSNTASDSVPRWNPSRAGGAAHGVLFDYFGTGRSDFFSLNAENGQLRFDILSNPVINPRQTRRVYWGLFNPQTGEGDLPIFGDYDGDGRADVGVWRRGSLQNPQSTFLVQLSSNPNPNAILSVPWGLRGDFPSQSGDYDGDGKDDFAVVREEGANKSHYILPSGGGNFRRVVFGLASDIGLTGGADFTGDRRDEVVAIRFNEANGQLTYFAGDSAPGNQVFAEQWGTADGYEAAVFGVGDYLGDSRVDLVHIFGKCGGCPNEGTWWINETGGGVRIVKFGIPLNEDFDGDFPFFDVDFDGDGKLDIAVFRPENSTFYWLRSSDGRFQEQFWDGNSSVPPSGSANLSENATRPRGKSIPAGALKAMMVTKQPDGTFKMERASDFYFKR